MTYTPGGTPPDMGARVGDVVCFVWAKPGEEVYGEIAQVGNGGESALVLWPDGYETWHSLERLRLKEKVVEESKCPNHEPRVDELQRLLHRVERFHRENDRDKALLESMSILRDLCALRGDIAVDGLEIRNGSLIARLSAVTVEKVDAHS